MCLYGKKKFNFLLNYKVTCEGNGANMIYLDSSWVFFLKVNIVFYEESSLCMGQKWGDWCGSE